MGANFGDVDNDGWLDFYLGTGQPRLRVPAAQRPLPQRRRPAASSTSPPFAAGFGHLQKGHGVAFGDLDNDGDQDLFAQMGGFYPADAFQDALFLNPGSGHRWVTLVLAGAGQNTRAVGARIEVAVERTDGSPRSIHRLAGSGGSFGASSLQQEIGLGDAARIVSVTVDWPGGERQVFADVPLESVVELTEGGGARVLERAVLAIGD